MASADLPSGLPPQIPRTRRGAQAESHIADETFSCEAFAQRMRIACPDKQSTAHTRCHHTSTLARATGRRDRSLLRTLISPRPPCCRSLHCRVAFHRFWLNLRDRGEVGTSAVLAIGQCVGARHWPLPPPCRHRPTQSPLPDRGVVAHALPLARCRQVHTHFVRYEDLLGRRKETLRSLADFLSRDRHGMPQDAAGRRRGLTLLTCTHHALSHTRLPPPHRHTVRLTMRCHATS